jgi:TonB family protein
MKTSVKKHIPLAIIINLAFILLLSNSKAEIGKDQQVIKISLISKSQQLEQRVEQRVEQRLEQRLDKQAMRNKKIVRKTKNKEIKERYVSPQYKYGSTNNPIPKYPRLAIRQKQEGKVIICVDVNKKGTVANIGVCNSSGHYLLDDAALKTIKNWKFEVAKNQDQIIAAKLEVPVTFSLSKS